VQAEIKLKVFTDKQVGFVDLLWSKYAQKTFC